MLLDQLSFKRKIVLLVAATVAGLSVITAVSIFQSRNDIVEGRKAALRSAVESAATIVAGFQAAAGSGTMTLAEMMAELPRACNVGCKPNSKGVREYWTGYKWPFK